VITALVPAPWSWAARALAWGLVAIALVAFGWVRGAGHVQTAWDAEQMLQKDRVLVVRARQAEATAQVVTRYVDRIRTVRVAGESIIREVPRYVPLDAPDLPGGWRVLHDAAARGEPADAARNVDAPAVSAQDAAATVAGNYLACHEQAEQLIALQDWVTAQREAAR
jgi:hypothetical protein